MMILLRILLLVGMIFLIWKAWRLLRPLPPPAPDDAFEPTVQCHICQDHVPRRDAAQHDGKFFCPRHPPDNQTDS